MAVESARWRAPVFRELYAEKVRARAGGPGRGGMCYRNQTRGLGPRTLQCKAAVFVANALDVDGLAGCSRMLSTPSHCRYITAGTRRI